MVHEREELEVAERLDEPHRAGGRLDPALRHPPGRPGMYRKHDRVLRGDGFDPREDPRESVRRVHVGRAVERQDGVAAVPQGQPPAHVVPRRARAVPQERVDHDVAHEVDPPGRDPFLLQVVVRVARRRQEDVGEAVRHEPVDLLGHREVARAEPGLDVRDGNARLRGNEGRRERGVHVSHDDDDVRALFPEHLLELHHHGGGLLRLRSAPDLEVAVGPREAELLEEDPRHLLVVVLARVHEPLHDARAARQRLHDGRDLHEVRPCADDVEDLHDARSAETPPSCFRASAMTYQPIFLARRSSNGRRMRPRTRPIRPP